MGNPRRPLIWSPEARADLTDIWNYYSQVAGPHTANNVVRRIDEACWLLEDHPYAGRSRNEVRPGLRSVVASPHVMSYRVVGDEVEIVRVIDGRRDIDQVFADADTT